MILPLRSWMTGASRYWRGTIAVRGDCLQLLASVSLSVSREWRPPTATTRGVCGSDQGPPAAAASSVSDRGRGGEQGPPIDAANHVVGGCGGDVGKWWLPAEARCSFGGCQSRDGGGRGTWPPMCCLCLGYPKPQGSADHCLKTTAFQLVCSPLLFGELLKFPVRYSLLTQILHSWIFLTGLTIPLERDGPPCDNRFQVVDQALKPNLSL